MTTLQLILLAIAIFFFGMAAGYLLKCVLLNVNRINNKLKETDIERQRETNH